MSFTGNDVDKDAQIVLTDPQHLTWSEADVLRSINLAVREVASMVPAACAFRMLIPMVALEARQSLPPGITRMIRADRNNNVAGTAPGAGVRPVQRDQLELQNRDWMLSQPGSAIRHVIYDENVPGEFWVWPRPAEGSALEATVNGIPPEMPNLGSPVPVLDVHRNAVVNLTLFFCYSKNQEDAVSMQTASQYYQLAAGQLVGKNAVDQKLAI